MVTASYMVEAIRTHQRQRAIIRALFCACCVGVLGYIMDGTGPLVTVPGRVVAHGPGTARIETDRETFAWTDTPTGEVWVDAIVGRFSGVLYVRKVRSRHHP